MRLIFGFIDMMVIQVSTSSGRLQLSDATGSIDVLITDIPLTWDFNTIYEVI